MPDVEPLADRADETRCLRTGRRTSEPPVQETPSGTHPAVSTMDIARNDLTGFCLGQYALGERIGSGGMGHVFHACHQRLKRDLAIKFLAADLSSHDECQRRFEQETLALGALQHPHIVNAVDAGSFNGLQYLVTEFIKGEDLAQLVARRGALRLDAACSLIRQAALGLAYSHARGFVHRDIKPPNLIVDRQGCLKILDFGLVRSIHVDHDLTDDGQTLGTWDFLAPEQAQDSSTVDHRCDIYSLGCTLLFLLSGGVPFGGSRYETAASKLKGHLFDAPDWLKDPPHGIPDDLLSLLNRMLAKSPNERIDSAEEVAAALAPYVRSDTLDAVAVRETSECNRPVKSRWTQPMPLVGLGSAWAIVALLCSLIPDSNRPSAPPARSPTTAPAAATPDVEEAPGSTGESGDNQTADVGEWGPRPPRRPYPPPRHLPPRHGPHHPGPRGHWGPPRGHEFHERAGDSGADDPGRHPQPQ